MDYFLGSIKIMLIVYALAAVISLGVAWIIKMIFVVIRLKKAEAPHKDAVAGQAGPVGRA